MSTVVQRVARGTATPLMAPGSRPAGSCAVAAERRGAPASPPATLLPLADSRKCSAGAKLIAVGPWRTRRTQHRRWLASRFPYGVAARRWLGRRGRAAQSRVPTTVTCLASNPLDDTEVATVQALEETPRMRSADPCPPRVCTLSVPRSAERFGA